MPGYKVHILTGLTAFFLLFFVVLLGLGFSFSLQELIFALLVAVVFSLLPDLDSDISHINNFFEVLFLGAGIIIVMYTYFVGESTVLMLIGIGMVLLVLASKFLTHRGFLHSIKFGLIVSLPLLYFGWIYFLMGLTAFLLHLVADDLL